MRIAVTGSTGYIGGRLVPQLLAEGHEVVCLVRSPAKLDNRSWADRVETVRSDLSDGTGLDKGLHGCDVAFYLVHSMGGGAGFESADHDAATRFAAAAARAGVRRIIYLGGLGDESEQLSPHLASRQDVGRALAGSGVSVTEFRAAVIIGSGSMSFEMLRHLTQVLPVMTTPRWVRTRCQPIAIRDVLFYLLAALSDEPGGGHTVYEIGGPDVLSYQDMMQTYARVAGLPKRLIVPVPVLSPGLSSLWVGLVTPLPVAVARPLIDSLRHEVVVHDRTASDRFAVDAVSFVEAVELAVTISDDLRAPTRWSDAEGSSPARPMEADPSWSGGTLFEDVREVRSSATTDDAFWAFSRIGGDVGYYAFDWAWQIRGLLDIVVGGVGLRRGRRHPTDVRPGDAIDFWRVADVDAGRRLELVAEMKLPGDAWLVWTAAEAEEGSVITQEAFFQPRGLLGRLYWYAMLPFHGPIFRTMLRNMERTATATSRSRSGLGSSKDRLR